MGKFNYLIVCLFANFLVFRGVSSCDTTAISNCVTAYTNAAKSSTAEACSALRTYLDCLDSAGYSSCTSGSFSIDLDSFRSQLDAQCGAAQFLLSWPMYMVVLALTLKRVYGLVE